MHYRSLADFLSRSKATLGQGPIGIMIAEDEAEVEESLRHSLANGVKTQLLLAAVPLTLPPDLAARVHHIDHAPQSRTPLQESLNPLIAATPTGTWITYNYNAEYLFFPFRETRSLADLTTFCAEERRSALLCMRVDLFAQDLSSAPWGVGRKAALDRDNYYSLDRLHPFTGAKFERQINLFGGLSWRYADELPPKAQRLDRMAIFRKAPKLVLQEDHRFNLESHNTYRAEWHHSPTAALASFRIAKALRRNPATRAAIDDFMWQGAAPFEWSSQQLMELGLMEPGQWH